MVDSATETIVTEKTEIVRVDPKSEPRTLRAEKPAGELAGAPWNVRSVAEKRSDDHRADNSSGRGEKYRPVKLVQLSSASHGVRAYIAMAEDATQTAVDLLGRNMPTPPALRHRKNPTRAPGTAPQHRRESSRRTPLPSGPTVC